MGNTHEIRFDLKNDFKTMDLIREESKQIFKSIDYMLSNEEIINQFLKAISIDNTNEEIIIEYGNFILKNKDKTYESDIKEYILFFKEFKDGRKEIFNFFDRLINYKNNWLDKVYFFQFLIEEIIFFNQIKYKNNLPFVKKYNNIYYCKLYESIIKLLFKKYEQEKKESLRSLIAQNKKKIDNYIQTMNNENVKKKIFFPITFKEIDKIVCCNFFQIFIKLLSDFINKIIVFIDYLKNESVEDFLNDVKKNELLDNFLFYIKNRQFIETDNPIITNEYFLFIDSALNIDNQLNNYNNENINITRLIDNKLNNKVIITYKDEESIEFNYELFSIGYACNKIKNQNNTDCNYKKLNFSKFDTNNIFRKNWENLKTDIIDIFSSECMKDFFTKNNLFDLFNYNKNELLNKILDNVIFYPFISKTSYACFSEDFQCIYLQGIGKEEITSAEYFIILYAFLIVCLIHELFHFYFSYLRFINKDKKRFSSPLPKNCSDYAKERGGESGEWIEENLFGRHIQDLSVKESLFIFSMKDHKGGYESFKKNFEKCKFNKDFKIGNFKKYIQKFDNTFVSFNTEKDNIDVDRSYILSDKKKVKLGVGEDIFFHKLSPYYQREFQNMENILLNKCMDKIREKKKTFINNDISS